MVFSEAMALSAGGSDALENQTTLCAFHHQQGNSIMAMGYPSQTPIWYIPLQFNQINRLHRSGGVSLPLEWS